jgi:hypothetical protein
VYWLANRLPKPSVWKIWGKRFDLGAPGEAVRKKLLGRNVRLHEHLAEPVHIVSGHYSIYLVQNLLLQLFLSSYLLDQQRHFDDVELVVKLLDLLQVLLLHLSSCVTLLAWVVLLGKE